MNIDRQIELNNGICYYKLNNKEYIINGRYFYIKHKGYVYKFLVKNNYLIYKTIECSYLDAKWYPNSEKFLCPVVGNFTQLKLEIEVLDDKIIFTNMKHIENIYRLNYSLVDKDIFDVYVNNDYVYIKKDKLEYDILSLFYVEENKKRIYTFATKIDKHVYIPNNLEKIKLCYKLLLNKLAQRNIHYSLKSINQYFDWVNEEIETIQQKYGVNFSKKYLIYAVKCLMIL